MHQILGQTREETEEDVDYFSCENYQDIVTPIKIQAFGDLLVQTNYDPVKTQHLVDGFTRGFDLGYRGPENRQDTAPNLPLRIGSRRDVWQKIMKEVKLNRYAGPFKKIPYSKYVQSPVGLVPKEENKTRLIFHLSYDFKLKDGKTSYSINHHTPKEFCTVKYKDLDFAIQASLYLKNNIGNAFQGLAYSKTDVISAFRILPIRPEQRYLLIIKAYDPTTGQVWYFVDKCLPFGASISCAQFQSFSDALAHVMEYKSIHLVILTNYLNDFFIVAYTIELCNELMREFIQLCEKIGCPTLEEKT